MTAPVDPLTGIEAARLGVYVHFPYCLSKCPYCDFASTAAIAIPQERYAQAVIRELSLRRGQCPQPVHSVYFGGGTPSLWDARCVGRVLEELSKELSLPDTAEISLEANPGAADAARFAHYRAAGINRLSIGVQSFQPATLHTLGRSHSASQADEALTLAREAGFSNLSIDLMYGVPGQSLAQALEDARRGAGYEPTHVSAYALTLDAAALAEEVPLARQLAKGALRLPSDDEVVRMADGMGELFCAAGLARYEISNWARPQFHSRHNALYWTQGQCLALGAGATGFFSTARRSAVRYTNHRSAERYLAAVERFELPEAAREQLRSGELFAERVAMGLRLRGGIDVQAACEELGVPYEPREAELAQLEARGMATRSEGRTALTEAGARVHTAICARLI